jgi:hypothetical protein
VLRVHLSGALSFRYRYKRGKDKEGRPIQRDRQATARLGGAKGTRFRNSILTPRCLIGTGKSPLHSLDRHASHRVVLSARADRPCRRQLAGVTTAADYLYATDT